MCVTEMVLPFVSRTYTLLYKNTLGEDGEAREMETIGPGQDGKNFVGQVGHLANLPLMQYPLKLGQLDHTFLDES